MSVVFLYGMKDNIVKTSTLLSRALLLVTKRTFTDGNNRHMKPMRGTLSIALQNQKATEIQIGKSL